MNRIEEETHQIPGLEVSWVGECPWTNRLCFGGEDGRLAFLPADGGDRLIWIQPATDTINAVAFTGEWIAISSRNEVVVGKRTSRQDPRPNFFPHSFIGGAHGIEASHSGAFLAPIGDLGLLILTQDANTINAQIASHQDARLNFYRLVRLGNGSDGEVFVAAARRDGLAAVNFADGTLSGPMIHHQFRGHDIVAACSLNDSCHPLAVACVSRDRVIFLLRDVLGTEAPIPLNYGGLEGTAYTLLSAQGHLLLLTDQELIAFPDLATRFLRGASVDRPLAIVSRPVDAVEAFLLGDRSILLIDEDSTVAEIRIAELVGGLAERQGVNGPDSNGQVGQSGAVEVNTRQPIRTDPDWQRDHPLELTLTPAA